MARYYFDIRDGEDVYVDKEGMELPDMEAAIAEARRALADMVRDSLRVEGTEALSIAIRDGADGPVVLAVNLMTINLSGV